MSTKPTVLCDIDGILLDFTSVYLLFVEKTTGRTHREEEIHSFNYQECIVSKGEDLAIWKLIAETPGLVYNLPLYEGAMLFLSRLRERGRVVACTSPAGPRWTAERAEWLLKAAFFDRKDIVVASDKALVHADYLVDDHFDNIVAWENAANGRTPGASLGVLLSRPWNWKHSHHTRAWNYAEVLAFIDECEQR